MRISAEQRLKELGIKLPVPPEPFGTYVEAVQTGNLLFLSGMLPTEGHEAKFIGRVGAELDVEAGRKAAHLAALNVLAVTRQHLRSLDKVTRIVRLGVSVATSSDVRTSRRSLTPLRSCCKTFSEKRRVLAAWCTESQVFRSALRSSWKSFSRWRSNRRQAMLLLGLPSWTRCLQVFCMALPVSVMVASFQLLGHQFPEARGKELPMEQRT
jgi:enamine deaminase RidA (YjgF/YER057c/UK114 family)